MLSFTHKVNELVDLVAEGQSEYDLPDLSEKGLDARGLFLRFYRVTADSKIEIGHTWFYPMPGCCGIVVSSGTYLTVLTRGSGLSNPFRDFKAQIARDLGYTAMIATTQMSNIPAVKNMFKSGYRVYTTFTNKRTNNLLGLGFKVL